MTTTEQLPVRKRRWSWLWIVLIISLAFNLAVLGALVAHQIWGGKHGHFRGPGYTQLVPRGFFWHLERERRKELLTGLKDARQEFKDMRKDLRDNGRAIADALKAEPFDPQKLETAMQGYEAASGNMITRGGVIARDLFAKLTAEERELMAKHIERRTRRHKKWRKWRKWRDD